MVMNLYVLFFASLPEAFLNIIIVLLLAGAKDKLKISKANVMRFVITLVLMLLFSYFVRPIAPNVVVNMIMHVIAYIIIFKLVYRLNLTYIALSVLFMLLIYTTVENLYVPFIITYLSKGMDNFSRQYHLYVVYALPCRICQIAFIAFFWKYQILLVTRISRRFHNFFIATTVILIITEYFLSYLFYCYFNIMALQHQIFLSIFLFVMVAVFNLIIFKLIYVTVNDLVTKGYKQYKEFEENAEFAFSEIQNMLKQNKINEAILLIDELQGKTI